MTSLSSGWDSWTAFRSVVGSVIFFVVSLPSSPVVIDVHGVFLNTILDQLIALEKIVRLSWRPRVSMISEEASLISFSSDSCEKVSARLFLSVLFARITSMGLSMSFRLRLDTMLCGAFLKIDSFGTISSLSFGPNLCGNLMVHVFFGKGVGVAVSVLIGVFCQVVD